MSNIASAPPSLNAGLTHFTFLQHASMNHSEELTFSDSDAGFGVLALSSITLRVELFEEIQELCLYRVAFEW